MEKKEKKENVYLYACTSDVIEARRGLLDALVRFRLTCFKQHASCLYTVGRLSEKVLAGGVQEDATGQVSENSRGNVGGRCRAKGDALEGEMYDGGISRGWGSKDHPVG